MGAGQSAATLVRRLVAQGHDPVPASPATGVDTITGKGLAEVVVDADVVVDVPNAPVWDDDAVMKFFTTSSRNLVAARGATLASATTSQCRSSSPTARPTAATCGPRSPRRPRSRLGLSTITRNPQLRSREFPTQDGAVSGGRVGELVHVGVPRLVRAPAGGAERVGELLGELADVERELTALLGR